MSRRTVATGQRRHRRGDCRATVPQSVAAAGGAGAVLLPLPPLELVGLCERTKRVCRRVVPRDHALRHPAVREWQHVHKQWKPSSQELREVRCSGGRHDSATQHSTHTTIKTITMGLSTATVKRRHATADGSRLPRKLIAPNTHGKQPLHGAAQEQGDQHAGGATTKSSEVRLHNQPFSQPPSLPRPSASTILHRSGWRDMTPTVTRETYAMLLMKSCFEGDAMAGRRRCKFTLQWL